MTADMKNDSAGAADPIDLVTITASLVAAYVSNNSLAPSEVPSLITRAHGAFAGLSAVAPAGAEQPVTRATPLQIRRSLTPDAIISFIDGKPYKTLKRHLGIHGLTLAAYRDRYGLPEDYPSVAPNYGAARSALARKIGLGRKR